MALPMQSSRLLLASKPYDLLSAPLLHLPTKSRFRLQSQNPPSEASNPSANGGPTTEPSSALAPPKKPPSPGLGFGPSSATEKKKKKKQQQTSRRERASVIRRSPVDKPAFLPGKGEGEPAEKGKNESAFVLAWLGLGSTILIEGIVLSASGFLPEELDKFFTKYLYPTFTPTVILFLAGGVAYGVLKYAQNEDLKEKK